MKELHGAASELGRHYLFSALSAEDLDRVAATAEVHRLGKGDILFQQGEKARRFFLVRSGQIKLYRLSPAGQEKVVDIMGPGRSFAEAVVFMQGGAYPVYAEALGDSEVISVDNEAFRETLRHSFDTCSRLMAAMSAHLHELVSEVEGLCLHNATFRVVSYLLQDARTEEAVHLELPKHVLAGRLSIKPETLSRILANLREEGLIEVRGQEIVLLDRAALRSRLEG
ncbi:MAG: Crp/Fnr family transcriptional regulator [Gammaproteobacteria bacterium]|jgi:CRP-like cAMP-binding protein|nr:Crp/Fnr family transcriptional regulator [Gammaproteobacteria bacterium]